MLAPPLIKIEETRATAKPGVLVVATSRWIPSARLTMALAQAGWEVDAVCPAPHPIEKIRGIRQIYPYRGLLPLGSVERAITASKPDLVIPGDDLASAHLHRIYARERRRGEAGQVVWELIQKSLGSPESFSVVYERAAFIELARKFGVRAPKTEVICELEQLRSWAAQSGFPAVLKANGTCGGDGVRVVGNYEEAEHAFRILQAPPSLLRAAKRALLDHDRTLLWPAARRRSFQVNLQEFAAGREATSAVACWHGRIVASLDFEVLSKRDAAGPSSVLRVIENAEMSFAAETMVRELSLSGLHGFDFMLDPRTQEASLIEINPRATQVGHLTLGPSHDLPAALYSAVTGKPLDPAAKLTEKDVIALFPQEWMRDPTSPFLQSGYHDVPWDEPELLRACAGSRKEPLAFNVQATSVQPLSPDPLPRV